MNEPKKFPTLKIGGKLSKVKILVFYVFEEVIGEICLGFTPISTSWQLPIDFLNEEV